jgi:hypothetical protein
MLFYGRKMLRKVRYYMLIILCVMFVKNLELGDKQSMFACCTYILIWYDICPHVHVHVNDINSDKNKLSQVKHEENKKIFN